tara:strand:+ start:2509 stop:2661 length:153 start_codon:yes stop_codon:yes gene_type:complete
MEYSMKNSLDRHFLDSDHLDVLLRDKSLHAQDPADGRPDDDSPIETIIVD